MPAFDEKLDDAQIAALVTYIRNAWGLPRQHGFRWRDVSDMRKQMKHKAAPDCSSLFAYGSSG